MRCRSLVIEALMRFLPTLRNHPKAPVQRRIGVHITYVQHAISSKWTPSTSFYDQCGLRETEQFDVGYGCDTYGIIPAPSQTDGNIESLFPIKYPAMSICTRCVNIP